MWRCSCKCACMYDDSLVMTLRVLYLWLFCVFLRMSVVFLFFLFVSLYKVIHRRHDSYSPYIIHVSLILISAFLSLSLFPVDDKNLLFLFFSTCFVLVLVCYAFFLLIKQIHEWIDLLFREKRKTKFCNKSCRGNKGWEFIFVLISKNDIDNWYKIYEDGSINKLARYQK